jgi:chitin disaccharide deacetylase
MAFAKPRRLIVNADDFGRSQSINKAVIQAHQNGILTSASMMVNGQAFDEAVVFAKTNPALGVGLHLTLVCGQSTLPPEQIPNLVNSAGEFRDNAVAAGMLYFFSSTAQAELEREIRAQIEKFLSTGLHLDHLNGHLHFHLHPTVWQILRRLCSEYRIEHVRLTNEPAYLNWRQERGRWSYRISHAAVFKWLSAAAREDFNRLGLKCTDRVFGLLQDGHVDETYLCRLLPQLPAATAELYSHPSLDVFEHEYDALVSQRVRELIAREKIELIRYQDL